MEIGNSNHGDANNKQHELKLFWHQVTGHNLLLKYDKHTLCKPLKERELRFYKHVESGAPQLVPFVPQFKGSIAVDWLEDANSIGHLIGSPMETSLISEELNSRNSPSRQISHQSTSSSHHDFQIKILHRSDSMGSHGTNSSRSGSHVTSPRRSPTPHPLPTATASTSTADDSALSKTDLLETEIEIEPPSIGKVGRLAVEARSASHWSLEHCADQLNKLRLQIERDGCKQFIMLENLTHRFAYPCVLDLKMGTRLHGDDETPDKKERKMRRVEATTSRTLGLRLGGMEVYDVDQAAYRVRDKYFGRSLNEQQLKQAVWEYFNNGKTCRFELLNLFIQKLESIIKVLLGLDAFRFFSSSLLLIYDGDISKVEESKVDVRLLDFAHTTWPEVQQPPGLHQGPDLGYVQGLRSLVSFLKELMTIEAVDVVLALKNSETINSTNENSQIESEN